MPLRLPPEAEPGQGLEVREGNTVGRPLREIYILTWALDRNFAERIDSLLAGTGIVPVWAAGLPDAISVLDKLFPVGVLCDLDAPAPTLMDLETLLAYESLGHQFVRLPTIPIWALSGRGKEFSERLSELGLPITLIDRKGGVEGLVQGMLAGLPLPSGGGLTLEEPVVVADSKDSGVFLSRYLVSRAIDSTLVVSPGGVLDRLASDGASAFVIGFASLKDSVALAEDLCAQAPRTPVILLVPSDAPRDALPAELPANVVCVVERPVKAHLIEACLRRLLRLPAPEPIAACK